VWRTRALYANACPTKEVCDEAPADMEQKAFQTWDESGSYVTYHVELAMNPQERDEEQF
jgi:hypothetical protein